VGKEGKREREVREGRGKGRGYAGARKIVCPGARVGSRRACLHQDQRRRVVTTLLFLPSYRIVSMRGRT